MFCVPPLKTPSYDAMPNVCHPVLVELAECGWFRVGVPTDQQAFEFLWTVGALRDWAAGKISGTDFARTLRRVASEVSRGS